MVVTSFYTGFVGASTGVASVIQSLDKGAWHNYTMTHSIFSLDKSLTVSDEFTAAKPKNTYLSSLKGHVKAFSSEFRMWLWRKSYTSGQMAKLYFKLFHLFRAKKLVKIFISNDTKCDFLIVHDIWSLITLKEQGYNLSKVIFVVHGSNDPVSFMTDVFPKIANTRFLRKVESEFTASLARVKSTVVLSEENRIQLGAKYGVVPQLIPNGIPKVEQVYKVSENLNLHMTGSLCSRKRQYLLIEVIAKLPSMFLHENNVVVNLFGAGPDFHKIKNRIKELRLEDRVTLHGNTDSPFKNYNSGDIILSLSTEEGLPVALLEGIRAGCVPIVTDVGGCHLTVGNNNGFLLSSLDDEGLISELCTLIEKLSNFNTRDSMASNSISLFESNFSNEQMVSLYAKTISS